ncbi:MAG TPA: HAD family phosphatase [Burkholderiaceae bacterium]|nr:HAD family phosphatase [Burkholderiaceae bacterium]
MTVKIEALIFDMDGTMIDSMPFHRRSWIDFAALHGIEMPIDEMMRRTTGRNGAECMSELFGRPVPHDQAWMLVREKERLYREAFAPPAFREVAGFRAFASHARARGLKLGVGTAGDAHNIAFALGHLALDAAPHAVVGGDEGLPGKPEPAIFLEVARRLGVAPAQCVVFEDAPLGIEAARRAGMRAVAVTTGHRADELAGPHVLAAIDHYDGLADAAWFTTLLEKHHAVVA